VGIDHIQHDTCLVENKGEGSADVALAPLPTRLQLPHDLAYRPLHSPFINPTFIHCQPFTQLVRSCHLSVTMTWWSLTTWRMKVRFLHDMLDRISSHPNNVEEMPPLVDNPNPSMTFTFLTDMSPITFSSTDPANFEVLPDSSTFSSPPASPIYPEDNLIPSPTNARASHGKKRDASYIPRPPNAFILFRSFFIKSEQVPGKVEGNHSTLSKIIGKSQGGTAL